MISGPKGRELRLTPPNEFEIVKELYQWTVRLIPSMVKSIYSLIPKDSNALRIVSVGIDAET